MRPAAARCAPDVGAGAACCRPGITGCVGSASCLPALFALPPLALLDLRRQPLELPDLQRQQDGVVALEARLAGHAADQVAPRPHRRRPRQTRAAGPFREISAGGRRADGWWRAGRVRRGSATRESPAADPAAGSGRSRSARRSAPGLRRGASQPAREQARNGTRQPENRRLEKFDLTIRIA